MPRPSTGHGANYGGNYGGGGIIRLTGLNPGSGGTILVDTFALTVGVSGALVDLATVVVTVNGDPAFSGVAFQGSYVGGSSYSYNPSENGYDFTFVRAGGYTVPGVVVNVYSETRDGASTTQTYSMTAHVSVVYPPVPLGLALGEVGIARFTGEAGGPLLGEAAGLAFFSPALSPHPGNQIDVKGFEVSAHSPDRVVVKQTTNFRPWKWGPAPAVPPPPVAFPPAYSAGYEPHLNEGFCFLKTTRRTVLGEMVNTMTSERTVILY